MHSSCQNWLGVSKTESHRQYVNLASSKYLPSKNANFTKVYEKMQRSNICHIKEYLMD